MLLPGIPFTNIGIAWQINGSIDTALLEAAINQVVAIHDATRLVLCGGHGVARQRVLPHAHVSLTVRDFSSIEDAEGRARAYMQEVFSQSFHPLEGLLWDTQLIVVSPARCYWLHRYQHLVTDGVGICIFWHACTDAYNRLPGAIHGCRQRHLRTLISSRTIRTTLHRRVSSRTRLSGASAMHTCRPPLFERAHTRALGSTSPS
jgi:hypothetical protein